MISPITPPTHLVELWRAAASNIPASSCSDPGGRHDYIDYIVAQASQWAADAELEACCEWLRGYTSDHMAIYFLRDARRPKPPSDADLALAKLTSLEELAQAIWATAPMTPSAAHWSNSMTNPTPNSLSPQGVPNNSARCPGSGSYEDGTWHWREGCDDCQRRIPWAGEGWMDPPPIIAFECEYRIGPDEIVAQGEHAPGPKPLSPAAEAIFFAADGMQPRQYRGRALAAALRALAVRVKGADAIRQDILDIATELENAQ